MQHTVGDRKKLAKAVHDLQWLQTYKPPDGSESSWNALAALTYVYEASEDKYEALQHVDLAFHNWTSKTSSTGPIPATS